MSRTRKASIRGGFIRLATAFAALTMLMAIPSIASAGPMRLFIDPGHGGHDPGAVGKGLMEKNSNLSIAKMVADAARRQGWQVKMSRTGDYFVPLNVRSRMANLWNATVFLSIHGNSTGNHNEGYMTIYRSPSGRRLGSSIMNRTDRLTPYPDLGNRQDVRGLAVLRGARQTAVLVEAMSVTASAERDTLHRPENRQRIAEEIVHAIAQYRGEKFVPMPQPQPVPTPPAPTPQQAPPIAPAAPEAAVPGQPDPAAAAAPQAPSAESTPVVTLPWAGGRDGLASKVPFAAEEPNPSSANRPSAPAAPQRRHIAPAKAKPNKPKEPNWLDAIIAFLSA